jgi:cytochrome b subunit of formate dehydrogenase/nitrate/TMAO reductase-like tetraheme cytochrome c subunit
MKFSLKVVSVISFLLLAAISFFLRSNFIQAQNPTNPTVNEISRQIKLECSGCHGPGTSLPKLGPGEQFHRDAHREYAGSIHARIQPNGQPAAVCKDCHTIKGDMATDLPPDNPKSTVFASNQEQTCGKCHENALNSFHTSIHGRLLDQGDVRAASCSDCHGRHTIQAIKDEKSKLNRAHLSEICIKCHSGIVPDYEHSAHGIAFKAGNDNAPVCIDCHSAVSHHEALPTTRDFTLQMIEKCSGCHEKQAPTYRDTFHGQATAFGYKPAATCADCHTPHKNLPQNNPASSVHPNHLVETCGSCHKDSNPSFATYNPHPEPKDPEKGFWTYTVNTFMKWLLLGVFGFFGIHTVLWLQRSIAALFRGETHKRIRDDEEQWVVRFSRRHRLTHVLIIVSFLGLAATGLPLMYSFTDWGRWLVEIHGGLGVTRFLHRACAIVTLFYASYHLWFIIQRAIVERDWSILWGTNSMMIRKQDFIDAFNMFRWFFYLGPKPKLDRFTYWEKFDYFAVFWGVPVIGLSGLMLWFPGLVTRFLPGEILNIAMIVHSEEALLATAFIFAFHFFHNHLRPENFPMDIVMFTGKMRLSWFKEERPVEYERMVAEGTLDSIIVPPPSLKFRVFARIFGFIAYFIGLFLVIAIFITLFTVKH